jgi:hypothetical protein
MDRSRQPAGAAWKTVFVAFCGFLDTLQPV